MKPSDHPAAHDYAAYIQNIVFRMLKRIDESDMTRDVARIMVHDTRFTTDNKGDLLGIVDGVLAGELLRVVTFLIVRRRLLHHDGLGETRPPVFNAEGHDTLGGIFDVLQSYCEKAVEALRPIANALDAWVDDVYAAQFPENN